MNKRYFNASIDEATIKLFRKVLLSEDEFKKLLKSCAIKFESVNNTIHFENGLYKHWTIFSIIPNLFGRSGETVESLYNCFNIVDFNSYVQVEQENSIKFLHNLINFRSQLINQGYHTVNLLLEDGYIIPIANALYDHDMQYSEIIEALENIGYPKLGYSPLEIKLFGDELYFERVAKGTFLTKENEDIIKTMHPEFNMNGIKDTLQLQQIGEANLKTLLFNLRQIDIEIFNNFDKNSIVLFSLLRTVVLELEGFIKQLPIGGSGIVNKLKKLLTTDFESEFVSRQSMQSDSIILKGAMRFFLDKDKGNIFFYHLIFFYFSRNYFAHNYFNTKENFEKMYDNGEYTPIIELHQSIVIVALVVEWKKEISNGE